MQTCQGCGEKNLNSATFCEDCGVKIESLNDSVTQNAVSPNASEADEYIEEGYIRTHFNGGHSLRRSYWINWFALNLILDVLPYTLLGRPSPFHVYVNSHLNRLFGETGGADFDVSSGEILWFAIRILISVWQAVGLWQSLRRGRGGRWLRGLVKTSFVLYIMFNIELILHVPFLVLGPFRRTRQQAKS